MLLKKKDNAYVMAFADYDGSLSSFYICDDLTSNTAVEAIWVKCIVPNSHYIFIWRRDGKRFSYHESKKLKKYVEWDLDECTYDEFDKYKEKKPHELEFPVFMKTADNRMCTILALYEMTLPVFYNDWKEFKEDMRYSLSKKLKSSESVKRHDHELDVCDTWLC